VGCARAVEVDEWIGDYYGLFFPPLSTEDATVEVDEWIGDYYGQGTSKLLGCTAKVEVNEGIGDYCGWRHCKAYYQPRVSKWMKGLVITAGDGPSNANPSGVASKWMKGLVITAGGRRACSLIAHGVAT
jgi:hypothetical protein